ncbi:MAG TPA: hypothetical protein VKI19_11875 [Acidimicrobiales bacterium]|nr:hypothetical protein [Acidimicrobiales bacterium]
MGRTIIVSWSAVGHSSSYKVYESTTSASSGFALVASQVASTSWTTASLSSATYWFEVASAVGTGWTSSTSTTTAPRTITGSNCF